MQKLNWTTLKLLNDLYVKRRSTAKLSADPLINNFFITSKKWIKQKRGGQKTPVWLPAPQFDQFYERWYKDKFQDFNDFFKSTGLLHTALQPYEEDDIATLIFVREHREEILQSLSSERTFLKEVFKKAIDEERESKYFTKHVSLKNAVLKLLDIDGFPADDPKENQWRFVVDCPTAKCVVLCENINLLKLPRKALENNIELCHVGGGNTKPLERLGPRHLSLPLFYSCDWDYHGLMIYSRIIRILKGYTINLLLPLPDAQRYNTKTDFHKCLWNFHKPFSGLERTDFSIEAQALIEELIKEDKWIEEEGNDVVEMVKQLNAKENNC
jgi:hypothetical protein